MCAAAAGGEAVGAAAAAIGCGAEAAEVAKVGAAGATERLFTRTRISSNNGDNVLIGLAATSHRREVAPAAYHRHTDSGTIQKQEFRKTARRRRRKKARDVLCEALRSSSFSF